MRYILNFFIALSLFIPVCQATVTVKTYQGPISQVCIPNDISASCTTGTGSSPWNVLLSNIYSNISDTVTVGQSTTSLDIFTVQSGSTGGETINSTASNPGLNANTQLLLPLNNSITDLSSNALTMINNNVTFANTSPAFAGTYYGVFNGSNAYLTSSSNVPNLSGTGDYTLEAQVYPLSSPGTAGWIIFATGNYASNQGIQFNATQDNVHAQVYENGGAGVLSQSYTFTQNAWTHIAVVRHSGFITVYSAGTAIGSAVSDSTSVVSGVPMIGYGGAGSHFNGYISNVDFYNYARYTSNFTPPPAPYIASGTPTLTLDTNASTNSLIKVNSLTGILSIVNNGITSLTINLSGVVSLPTLTANGIVTTSGGAGLLGITSTTGTGNVVLSTTPTFITSLIDPLVIGSTSANGTLTLEGNSATTGNTGTNIAVQINVGNSGATNAITILNNGNVGIGITNPFVPLSLGTATGNKIALYDGGSTGSLYGFGIQSNVLQIFSPNTGNRVGIGYGNSGSFTETLSVMGNNVGIGDTSPLAKLDIQSSVTSAAGVAYGTRLQQTLTATANSDNLYGLYINPTFTNGAFTSVNDYGLYVNASNNYISGLTTNIANSIEETFSTATSVTPTGSYQITVMNNTQSTGTFTVNNPTNNGVADHQVWCLQIDSSSVQTFSWSTNFNGGVIGLPVQTLGSSTWQNFYFYWNTTLSKWVYQGSS